MVSWNMAFAWAMQPDRVIVRSCHPVHVQLDDRVGAGFLSVSQSLESLGVQGVHSKDEEDYPVEKLKRVISDS